MQIFSAAWRTGGSGSTTLPIASLYATTGVRPRLIEVGCFNTNTANTLALSLRRLTSAGTAGTATITAVPQSGDFGPAVAVPRDTHTGAPTIAGGALRRATLPAYDGIIWTFQEPGLLLSSSAGAGFALIPGTGSGRICDVSFTWIE